MKNIYRTLKNKLSGLAKDRRGQTMTEYALLVGFLAAAAAIFLSASGDNVKTSFANMGSKLDSAVADSGGTPVADNSTPTPSDTPSGASDGGGNSGDQGGSGDDGGSGGDDGGKDKKDKSNNSDNDNGNGNKYGHDK